MPFRSRIDPARVLGRAPERLTIDELVALAGRFVAIQCYTPEATPLRAIQAIGETAEECVAQLAARGLNAKEFEFTMLKPPY